jgi:hypothetical protein
MNELLTAVKLLVGIELNDTDKDSLLLLYLQRGQRIILSSIIGGERMSEVPERYMDLLIDAAVTAYNQQGAEGTLSTSSNGISQQWQSGGMAEFIRSKLPAKPVIA